MQTRSGKEITAVIVLILSACGIDMPYWTLTNPPAEVKAVLHVKYPCGNPTYDGCWNSVQRTIEVRDGLSVLDEDCVITHERKHAAGYTHPIRPEYSTDCGDGTKWIPSIPIVSN